MAVKDIPRNGGYAPIPAVRLITVFLLKWRPSVVDAVDAIAMNPLRRCSVRMYRSSAGVVTLALPLRGRSDVCPVWFTRRKSQEPRVLAIWVFDVPN